MGIKNLLSGSKGRVPGYREVAHQFVQSKSGVAGILGNARSLIGEIDRSL